MRCPNLLTWLRIGANGRIADRCDHAAGEKQDDKAYLKKRGCMAKFDHLPLPSRPADQRRDEALSVSRAFRLGKAEGGLAGGKRARNRFILVLHAPMTPAIRKDPKARLRRRGPWRAMTVVFHDGTDPQA